MEKFKLTHYQYLELLRQLSRLNPDSSLLYKIPIVESQFTFKPKCFIEDDEKVETIKVRAITFFYHQDYTGQNTWMPKESIEIIGWDEQKMLYENKLTPQQAVK